MATARGRTHNVPASEPPEYDVALVQGGQGIQTLWEHNACQSNP